jgi:hypothetical protein
MDKSNLQTSFEVLIWKYNIDLCFRFRSLKEVLLIKTSISRELMVTPL